MLFPTGRLPSPRWRPVAQLGVVAYFADVVGRAFAPGPIDEEWFGPLPNPLGIEAAAGLAPVALSVVTVLLLPTLLAAAASLLVRLRQARGAERLQLKWFCYAAALFGAAVLVVVVVVFPSLTPAWAGNELSEELRGGPGNRLVNHLRLQLLRELTRARPGASQRGRWSPRTGLTLRLS